MESDFINGLEEQLSKFGFELIEKVDVIRRATFQHNTGYKIIFRNSYNNLFVNYLNNGVHDSGVYPLRKVYNKKPEISFEKLEEDKRVMVKNLVEKVAYWSIGRISSIEKF